MSQQTVQVTSSQMLDIQADIPAALVAVKAAARAAEKTGAEVAVFPECFLCGYCATVTEARPRAMDLCGSAFGRILGELGDLDPVLVVGLIESDGGELFNTVVVIEHGRLLGSYRKRHPNETCFSPGSELPIFQARGLRFGLGVCADARDAADGRALAEHRPDAVFYPLNNMLSTATADRWRLRHTQFLLQRAKDTGATVISSDVVGQRGGQVAYGCTVVARPDGRIPVRVPEETEGMLLYEVPVR